MDLVCLIALEYEVSKYIWHILKSQVGRESIIAFIYYALMINFFKSFSFFDNICVWHIPKWFFWEQDF